MDSHLKYSYLLMGLIFLVIWTFLFIFRKNLRREMLTMSILFGIAGALVERVYLHDWWFPATITGTRIGLEDFLFGFVIGGISASIYEFIFRKRLRKKALDSQESKKKRLAFAALGLFFIAMFAGCFFLLSLNTLQASIIAFVSATAIVYFARRDLIIPSLVTGGVMVILACIVYSLTELITPGWVQAFWYFKNIPNIVIFAVPIDDFIWYFLAGAFIAPLYEYWQEARLVKE
jgi:hypothetical protein